MTPPQKNFLILFLIVAACAVVYSQTYAFDFINIDDRAYVWENPAVQSGLNSRSIRWALTAFHSANWHPLTWLSHMLDAQLFGPWAGGHHLTNALLHAINSILLFVVLRWMTESYWKSGIVALLFAVHPAHVESVAWIAERKDVLSTTFWLLTMLAYVRYTRRIADRKETKGSRWLRMWPVVILYALGLTAKPMLVTLPFALLLCDYWPLGRLNTVKDLRPLIVEKLPLFALTVASSIITLIAQSSAGATASLGLVPFSTRVANVITSYGRYLRMLLYPVELGIWYPLDPVINPIIVLGAAALLVAISFAAWRYRAGREYLLVGWLWFLGTLVPVIGLVQVGLQSHADRYTYIPYIGLFIMLTWGVVDLSKKFDLDMKLPAILAVIVLSCLTVLAYRQASLWRNSEGIYQHTLSFTENNQFLMTNLCLYYIAKADPATADNHCSDLLGKMPPSPDGLRVLGYLKIQTGKYDEAERLLQDASRLDPTSGQTLFYLAQAVALRGNVGEAEPILLKAVTMKDAGVNPEILARASLAVGDGFLKTGRNDKAAEYYRRALSVRPNMPEARSGLERSGVK